MTLVRQRHVLTGMRVREAMRKQVVSLPASASVMKCIPHLIKHKISAVLVIDKKGRPLGVVSKTDIMGAFYAALSLETPLEHIMVGPPITCFPDDELEVSIDAMRDRGIHRLYVLGADAEQIVGTLAYPDIVGLLYRYCRACDKSRATTRRAAGTERLTVNDVMTPSVFSCGETDRLYRVMEGLSGHRFGAVLIMGTDHAPTGVISKTDLILAYYHGVSNDCEARSIMKAPVRSCEASLRLSEALQLMLVTDIGRIFVYRNDPSRIAGVLSLSDAARFRSGSCRACAAGRMMLGA